MLSKEEIRDLIDNKIEQLKEQIADCKCQLDKVKNKLSDISDNRFFREYTDTKNELYQNLDDQEKELIKNKDELDNKKKIAMWLGLAVLAVYALAVIGILLGLNPEFSIPDIAVYAIAIVVGIVIYVVPVSIVKNKLDKKIKVINSDPGISEYNKKCYEALKTYMDNTNNNQTAIDKYNREAAELKDRIEQLEAEKMNCFAQLDELDFNYAFGGCILFYGKEKRNYYDIYIDGHLYDTVRGHQIIKIMLTPGLHSFKLENTSYNLVDRSEVDYRYSFNTKQFEVSDIPEAYAFVCEFKTLTRVTGEEFQNITKTKLI